jgi:hypothetical protein
MYALLARLLAAYLDVDLARLGTPAIYEDAGLYVVWKLL